MSYKQLHYRRWDGKEIRFTVNVEPTGKATITSKPELFDDIQKGELEFDFTHLSISDEMNIAIQSGAEKLLLSKERFYSAIEGLKGNAQGEEKLCTPICVNNVSEYMKAINYYRYISLINHLNTLKNGKDVNELGLEAVFSYLGVAIEDTAFCDVDALQSTIIGSFRELNNMLSAAKKSDKNDSVITNIYRAINTYRNGGSFCYYRGVGHVYYPESPGIFRKDHLHEEARWYRMMKSNFHDSLDSLHYLDRLAMMQHYDLPTRLLDVTANPLVALYMAVNKIYTKDDPMQLDYAEIITYFDELTDTKAYDSSSVLVLAALAKLSYEEKESLRIFINILENAIEEKSKITGIPQKVLQKAVNYCVHKSALHNDFNYYFAPNEKNMITDTLTQPLEKPSDICTYLDIAMESKPCSYDEFINVYAHLLITIRRENPAFIDHIDIFMLTKAYHVRVGMTNDRVRVQNGSFIICGLDKDYINTKMNSSRSPNIRRLFITDKGNIYRELNSLAINDMTMFPDMAHQANYLKEQRY